jgi:hypothetical protein
MIENYLKIWQNADEPIETRLETKHERKLFYNERESSIWKLQKQRTMFGCTRCECEPLVAQNFAPVSKPNRTRGSGEAIFRSKSLSLGTQLKGVPLWSITKNGYADIVGNTLSTCSEHRLYLLMHKRPALVTISFLEVSLKKRGLDFRVLAIRGFPELA